ncbi:MAG: GTP cyclohydrolase I, partial [Spirochaetes bacterium]|nr:GTP cyclohydrolase I [Spirochaetota bacterium]
MQIKDWLAANVTDDKRALEWFDDAEAEPRIRKAYKELLEGYTIDTSKLLKTTREIGKNEKFTGSVTVRDINYFSICAHHFLPF